MHSVGTSAIIYKRCMSRNFPNPMEEPVELMFVLRFYRKGKYILLINLTKNFFVEISLNKMHVE